MGGLAVNQSGLGSRWKNAPGVVATVFGVFVCSWAPAKAVEGHTHSRTLACSPHAPRARSVGACARPRALWPERTKTSKAPVIGRPGDL